MSSQRFLFLLACVGLGFCEPAEPPNRRVLNGQNAHPHEAPFLVLMRDANSTAERRCSGTILTKKWILSAAHCKEGIRTSIIAGAHDVAKWSGHEQFRRISKFIRHPAFDWDTLENDIALYRVNKPFKFNQYVQPIPLPPSEKIHTGEGTLYGWGFIDVGFNFPDVLRTVHLPIIDNAECQKMNLPEKVTSSMICAGPEDGKKSSCKGDSGSPFVQTSSDGKTEFVGLVSWGRQSCSVDERTPSVLTRVSAYVGWIKSKLK